jgi:hypothetical protein
VNRVKLFVALWQSPGREGGEQQEEGAKCPLQVLQCTGPPESHVRGLYFPLLTLDKQLLPVRSQLNTGIFSSKDITHSAGGMGASGASRAPDA